MRINDIWVVPYCALEDTWTANIVYIAEITLELEWSWTATNVPMVFIARMEQKMHLAFHAMKHTNAHLYVYLSDIDISPVVL